MKKAPLVFLAVLVFSGFGSITSAQSTDSKVYSLFLINIAKYSSWPEDKPEFHIAVMGNSTVYDELQQYAERGINGKKMKLSQAKSVEEVGDAHIVYLPYNSSSRLEDLIKATEGKSIMIVTERPGLHKKGAGFSFFVNDKSHLRFDINMTDLDKRRIKVAKNLAGMAHEVI